MRVSHALTLRREKEESKSMDFEEGCVACVVPVCLYERGWPGERESMSMTLFQNKRMYLLPYMEELNLCVCVCVCLCIEILPLLFLPPFPCLPLSFWSFHTLACV